MIVFQVNGKERRVEVSPDTPLLCAAGIAGADRRQIRLR